jgi:5-methylcytosine-specific restriction endonuclease McrA
VNETTFDELLKQFGHTIQITGVIYGDKDRLFLALLPNEPFEDRALVWLEDLDQEAWKKLVHQTDMLETEVLAQASDGKLAKVIVRKSTRQISQNVSWAVYRRDKYKCRYCGRDDVPLTVDHLILWEEGGPSIEENLVACCRKCNKTRGNMQFEDWLTSDYCRKVGENLTEDEKWANVHMVSQLRSIPRRYQQRGR